MRFSLALIFVALLGLAPAESPRLVVATDGIANIAWENTTEADSVVVANVTSACPYPVVKHIDPAVQHVVTQVPEGPPYEGRCLLRPGDRLHLLRYRGGAYVDQEGPFIVAYRAWVPMVVKG